jgi:hypothetical protein
MAASTIDTAFPGACIWPDTSAGSRPWSQSNTILTAVWHVLPGNTGRPSLACDNHAKRNAQRALMHHLHANRFGYPSASTQSTPHH